LTFWGGVYAVAICYDLEDVFRSRGCFWTPFSSAVWRARRKVSVCL
jgi:hypothetical protein